MLPFSIHTIQLPLTNLVAASHHVSLSDDLNGYCLNFFSAPKDFNK
ncbi:hypothetical protein [Pontibacter populi]|uniref:Uncharacterized protein n=1 Tax=Pontibacter populi TaxID=890055 RepID=A0ABV1RQS1_9BACT